MKKEQIIKNNSIAVYQAKNGAIELRADSKTETVWATQDKGSAAKALAKVGATSYFGVLTRTALAEFQAQAGISPASGNFGPITRAYLSKHY
ncbi:MAG: peptidoglycan-binding domain-containing protein [Patescibacteria group bacterium]|jgi:peptidoglycan hydrolase-like protein with peptidoglycan-binding domain